ncbi:MAG TPA: hypothetical protein DCE56_04220 [Cyanobacteria bacterium UBA8553]|jgi:hypothetical protein|nr:hypothetical protein [Cyanobacteria bacterium UBA8553]HAJ58297.1 hypothetical protein [Cyanobacteria bacterium UBA8543]
MLTLLTIKSTFAVAVMRPLMILGIPHHLLFVETNITQEISNGDATVYSEDEEKVKSNKSELYSAAAVQAVDVKQKCLLTWSDGSWVRYCWERE